MKNINLPVYNCHKTVQAVLILSVSYDVNHIEAKLIPEDIRIPPIIVGSVFINKHKPSGIGYFVIYNDGYTSWSPVEAFESGYTRCDTGMISFSKAIDLLKQGFFVARAGWNGKGMYLFLIGTDSTQQGIGGWTFTNGKNDNKELLPFIAMKTADDKVVPWLASQTDLLADDWMIIDDCGVIDPKCNSLLNDQTPPLADFINMCERGKALKEELGN